LKKEIETLDYLLQQQLEESSNRLVNSILINHQFSHIILSLTEKNDNQRSSLFSLNETLFEVTRRNENFQKEIQFLIEDQQRIKLEAIEEGKRQYKEEHRCWFYRLYDWFTLNDE
jgi:hypothetical protein